MESLEVETVTENEKGDRSPEGSKTQSGVKDWKKDPFLVSNTKNNAEGEGSNVGCLVETMNVFTCGQDEHFGKDPTGDGVNDLNGSVEDTTSSSSPRKPCNNTEAFTQSSGFSGASSLDCDKNTIKSGLSYRISQTNSLNSDSSNSSVFQSENNVTDCSKLFEVSGGDTKVASFPPKALSDGEEQHTKEFLEKVNGARVSKGASPLCWNAAVKFLNARKFNVRRAYELYEQHQYIRISEGLYGFEPFKEPLKSELTSGKFTVLPSRDVGGAAIAVFCAKLHQPSETTIENTLKGMVYQLDAALENPQTQRCGLLFIYDMSGSKYSNFDYDLSIKILSLLKGGYPARLKKVLIVTAPLWFRAPFKILRLFVREKLRDRVFTVSIPQLGTHIPPSAIPESLGGKLKLDHLAWLEQCHKILSSGDPWESIKEEAVHFNSLKDMPKQQPDVLADNEVASNLGKDPHNTSKKMRRNGQSTPSPAPNSSGSSGFSDDDSLPFDERHGLTVKEFVRHLHEKGRRGLLEEYDEIVSKNPEGSFTMSKQKANVNKNRYSDVLCFDHTRVVLNAQGESESDYINANFVDGYKQKNAFISTQGPLPRTYGDFWKMVWDQGSVVIVMATRAIESGRTKCGQYWPPDKGSVVVHEGFKIENLDVESYPDYLINRIKLTQNSTGLSRSLTHLQFISWPDYGVPSSAEAVLKFISTMREEQLARTQDLGRKWDGHILGPPIVVHCSAGIGRTGTLCTVDICIKRLDDQGIIDVMGTVEKIRSQRAYSIQVPDQYLFCHAAIVEYARANGYLVEAQVNELPDLLVEGVKEGHLEQKPPWALLAFSAALLNRLKSIISFNSSKGKEG